MITFTVMTSAGFVENGVYAMITFTGMTSAAFVENGVYAMITFTGMTSAVFFLEWCVCSDCIYWYDICSIR